MYIVYVFCRHGESFLTGAFEIANYDLTAVFVEKLWSEIPAAKKLLLSTLHHIMEYAEIRRDLLVTPAMKYFTAYLQQSEDLEIREGAARCTGDLAVEILGKSQANACGTVEILTDLLMQEPEDRPTMAPISYALMMLVPCHKFINIVLKFLGT